MGAHVQFLRVKKLKGCGIIKTAARHNLREIQAELGADSYIDPAQTINNQVLRGATTAAEVAAKEKLLLEQVARTLRKDAVRGLEVIFSLPPLSAVDEHQFFADAVAWAAGFFEVPILSAVIHNDEAAPHCHVLMLPLFDGRMTGGKLVGNKQRIQAMQADFFIKVAQSRGLTRTEARRRPSRAARVRAAAEIMEALGQSPRWLQDPVARDALKSLIEENPVQLMVALGLEIPHGWEVENQRFASETPRKLKQAKSIGFGDSSRPEAPRF